MSTNLRTVPSRTGRMLWTLVSEILVVIGGVIIRGARHTERWLTSTKHAQYGLSITRILLGVHGMGIVAANFATRYYAYGAGSAWTGQQSYPGSDFAKIWLFSWFPFMAQSNTGLTISLIGLFALALLVTLGWRTKIVLPVYGIFFVSWIEMNDVLSDQSDNIIRMVLIYMLFADTSIRLSLDARRRMRSHTSIRRYSRRVEMFRPYNTIAHNLVLVVMTMHVGFVYMSGALYKAQGSTWANGYAVYNPLHVARFSTWPEIADVVTTWGPAVVAISWGTIVIQMMFLPMLINRVTRIVALIGIMSFHVGIGVLMGLPFFSLAMVAIDAIFVRDSTWKHMGRAIRAAWAGTRPTVTGLEARVGPATEPAFAHTASIVADPAWVGSPDTADAAEPDGAAAPKELETAGRS